WLGVDALLAPLECERQRAERSAGTRGGRSAGREREVALPRVLTLPSAERKVAVSSQRHRVVAAVADGHARVPPRREVARPPRLPERFGRHRAVVEGVPA